MEENRRRVAKREVATKLTKVKTNSSHAFFLFPFPFVQQTPLFSHQQPRHASRLNLKVGMSKYVNQSFIEEDEEFEQEARRLGKTDAQIASCESLPLDL